jgi:hypothetical protein
MTLLVVIARAPSNGRAALDQDDYHLPVIRQFARELPRPNFSDYPSGTTPAYHLVLAVVGRIAGVTDDVHTLRVLGSLFTLGLIATLAYPAARRLGAVHGTAVSLPLLCSLYVVSSGAWVLPDNAAWWGMTGILLVALAPWAGGRTVVWGATLLLVTVLTRQTNLWAAAALWVAALIGTDDSEAERTPALLLISPSRPGATARLLRMFLATVPAFAAVAYFVWLWKGTVPPSMRFWLVGGNLAAPAAILCLIGVITPFYAGYLWPAVRMATVRLRGPLLIGAAVGFLIGILPETSYDVSHGRWSGLWNAAKRLPVVADRSPLIVLLATVGGAALGAWTVALPRRAAWVFLVAWAGFATVQAMNAFAFQRYYEPMVLIAAALAVAHLPPAALAQRWRIAWAGPATLALSLAAVTYLTLR